MVIFAAFTAALAVFFGVYTLTSPARPRSVSARLNRFDRTSETDREARLAAPFAARVGSPIMNRVRAVTGRLLPGSLVTTVEHRLMIAGEPASLHAWMTAQIAMAAVGFLTVILAISIGAKGSQLLLMLAVGLIVALLPLYWLRIKVAARQKAILRAFPDAVDLIVTSVEAGLAIDAALSEVGEETQGPLGEELRLTVRETTLGRSRRDALQRLIYRTEVPELKSFVQALIQAEQTGIPIGQVLRTQAAQVRVRKRQRTEVAAQRAPVKMIIVLVLFVLPAMMLVLMGPALIRMSQSI